jgi:cyanophycinase
MACVRVGKSWWGRRFRLPAGLEAGARHIRYTHLAALALFAGLALAAPFGPARGWLVIVGGGQIGPEIVDRFIQLAGGKDSPMVFIPTAEEGVPRVSAETTFLARAGVKHVSILHTRDRKEADSEAFVLPLKTARAVWFEGGRQWRLVDSYLNTRTQKELFRLLKRGGVIGGTSAGATIQGSYLVRGARESNTLMMAPGYETGLGFLRLSAIDQHVVTRHREGDLGQVIDRHPELLGIGIDESTAIVVHGDTFEVIGRSMVFIHDARSRPQPGAPRWYTLAAGDRFDLKTRHKVEAKR